MLDVTTLNENNKAHIRGILLTPFVWSHNVKGEDFYNATVKVERLSGQIDEIPIQISDRAVNLEDPSWDDAVVDIYGDFRSYNSHEPNSEKRRLILSLFVTSIRNLSAENSDEDATTTYTDRYKSINNIYLNGYLCKPPVYRKTPLGREICDLLLAVNRRYGKTDYVPCVCWGRDARFASGLAIGDNVIVDGRIQSRPYYKRISPEKLESRIAYEVSASTITLVDDPNK